MKISLKHQTTKKNNSAACAVTEYHLNHDLLDAAIATIEGRYPDQRRVTNQQCNELAFVMEGEGKVVINQQEYLLSSGDIVLIEKGEKYYWEGKMKLFLSCSPAWNIEQHQAVD